MSVDFQTRDHSNDAEVYHSRGNRNQLTSASDYLFGIHFRRLLFLSCTKDHVFGAYIAGDSVLAFWIHLEGPHQSIFGKEENSWHS